MCSPFLGPVSRENPSPMGFVSLTAGLMPCGSSSWPVWAGIGPQVNLRPCHPSMPSTVRRCSAFTCSCHKALFACSAARLSRRSLNLNRSKLRANERMNERSPPNPNARARIYRREGGSEVEQGRAPDGRSRVGQNEEKVRFLRYARSPDQTKTREQIQLRPTNAFDTILRWIPTR